ncbi:MAG: tetratricopeptide repeat protein [Sedimentisphaerales bacterium]|nr:tetratricopeptide repeat protein [Sedimentisphaerales bacterium]
MPRRYFNWKLAIVLFIGCAVFGVSVFGLRQWRKANSAEKGLDLGNKAYDEQNWEEAAKEFGRYIAVNQNDVDVLMKYADAQLKIRPATSDNIQQAAQAYRTVLRIKPDSLKAAQQLTELYLLMGRYDDAELVSGRQLETNPNPELNRLYVLSLVQKRKFHEAAEELRKLCAKNPNQVLAYETAGQLAEQHPEEFSEPIAYWYNEAVKNNPSSALAYIVRAGFYRRSRDIASALADLERAEKQEFSESAVYLKLASEYIQLNLLDKAEQILAKVHEMSPADQGHWQLSAQAALMSRSKEKMLKTARAGLEELSSQPWDFMPMAVELYIRSGDFDKARDCITQLNQKNFEPANVSYLEGLLFAEKGDFLNAAKRWEYSIQAGNNSIRVKLELASVLLNLGDTQSAISQLRTLVSQKPDSAESNLSLAKILAQTGNWTEAREYAAKAVQLAPGNTEALLLLAQAQIQMPRSGSDADNVQKIQSIETFLSNLDSAGAGSIEIELLRFQLEMQKGNYTRAQEMINQLKQKYQSHKGIPIAEAELFAVQNKISEAAAILRQAIEKFPDASGPVKYLAALLETQGDKDGCIGVISEALQRINEPVIQRELNLLLVAFYTRWNQNDRAYEQLEMIAKKLPDDIPIKRRLLLCEQVMENPDEAQKLIDDIKALEGDDGWQWRYEQARMWYISKGFKERYPQIVSLMQKNILGNPNDQASRLLLARTYEKTGELQLAISAYREAMNRSPENIQIITALVSALYKIKEYDQAEELLKRVPAQSLQDPQLQRLQLQNYLRQGQYDSASDILHGLVGSDPNDLEAGLALALLEMQQGKLAESEKMLAKLKANDPCSLSIAAAQIQLNLKLEKPQEAIKVCDEFVNNLKNASAYILRARTYASLKQADLALKDLENALAIEPENAQVWMARSDYYSSAGRQDKALEDVRKAMSLDSNNVQIQKRAVALLLTSNQSDMIREGKDIIDQALKANPDDIELRLFRANSLFAEGTAPAIENARQILQKITQESPEYSQAWLMLGEIMLKKDQLGSAMDYVSRGLAYKPGDEALLFLKARTEAVRSPVLAIPTLKELCDLNPDNVEAVTYLANIYVAAGEPGKAVSCLQNVLTRCNSSNTRTYNVSLAAALYKAGNKAESQTMFDSLINDTPDDPALFLAQVYLLRDDRLWGELKNKTLEWYRKHPENSRTPSVIAGNLVSLDSEEAKKTAEEIFRAVLKNDSKNTDVLNSLAVLLGMTGRSEEAADVYKKLLEYQPENIIAMNNLAWIVCENQGQPQQALELAQKGLKIAPDYIDLIDTRGMAYFRLGQFQKAIQDFSRCVEMYPESTPQSDASRFHLARAYAGLKQNAKAIGYLKEVLDSENRTKGLTAKELAEAQNLLTQLQEDI